MQRFRVINEGVGSAGWNMAVDEALLCGFGAERLPVLRLYGWEPSLTLGRFQNAGESIDLEKAAAGGLSCVRRMTGGSALVHGNDLSYALVLPRAFAEGRGVRESYRFLCGFLLRLYDALGLKAAFACDLRLAERRSELCLAGREACDIVIGGRKMGGNAQRYTRNTLFQHGTIPLGIDAARFAPLFSEADALEEAATLERLGVAMTPDALRGAAVEAFCETFGAEAVPATLTKGERRYAEALLAGKYAQRSWNVEARSEMA